ncbi:MAG: esterase-like activity of phytase family protein [Anaerolineae bacterium]
MRPQRFTMFIIALSLLLASTLLAVPVGAQGAKLVGYALTPAETVTDGDPAGAALASNGTINGLSMPFSSQPFGAIIGLLPGSYAGYFEALTSATFERPDQSADFLLRIYTLEIDFRRADGGSGAASPVAWITLTDPRKLLGDIARGGERTRPITGADVTPCAFTRLADGSYWIADAKNGTLLHFDNKGKLLTAPISLSGGAIMGLSSLADGTLVVAQGGGGTATFSTVSADGSIVGSNSYPLDSGSSSIDGFTVLSNGQAFVIENDGQDNGGSKRVYRIDINNPASKALVIDLNGIDDSDGLSGLGNPFRFPYAQIGGIALDGNDLVLVNNNRVPFSQVRQPGSADPTEFIKVRIG